ncbi:hypothetical protein G6F46_014839 [Rhizopus delemar]|nr:hypothetical protein G6F46_014839 [Rhizopus delemar]
MAGRTTLILAHRLASVIGADRRLVLDQGRVVEAGPHAELMAQRGLYYRLMHEQAAAHQNPSAGSPAPAQAALAQPQEAPAAASDDKQGPALRALDQDAEQGGWRATLGTLLSVPSSGWASSVP